MPRLVIPQHPSAGRFAGNNLEQNPPDKFADRLVKYVPIESVTLYTLTDKLVAHHYCIGQITNCKNPAPHDPMFMVLPWFLFLLGLVGTPFYLYRSRVPKQPWIVHAVISTVAFCLWVYTLGGTIVLIHEGWYIPLLASILAPVFTYVAGIVEPKPV